MTAVGKMISGSPEKMVNRRSRAILGGFLAVVLLFAGTIGLEQTPPLYWDEGWTLSVARNWVEHRHYGRLLNGQLVAPGLEAAFPVVAPIAFSFGLFGVGVYQGRLVGVLFLFGALGLIYYLARRLYDPSIALATILVLVFMSMYPAVHPIFIGRTVLAEMPMLFYLLVGYAFFLNGLDKSLGLMPLALFFWGIALITKAQVLPFWTLSLALPLIVALFARRWNLAALFTVGLAGSWVISRILLWLQGLLLEGHTLPKTPLQGLYEVTAIVPSASNRLYALQMTLIVGLPTLAGLLYATWKLALTNIRIHLRDPLDITRFTLIALSGSWFAWYLFLSVGWLRYLFPATFIGSIFVAAMLRDLTGNFDLSRTVQTGGRVLRRFASDKQSLRSLVAIILLAWSIPITLKTFYKSYFEFADTSAQEVADFFNRQSANDVIIETYESELHFLLNRPYHYPPDQVIVELNRRNLGEDVRIEYDPLFADPDFLVLGTVGRGSGLYEPVLQKNEFLRLKVFGDYEIFARLRNTGVSVTDSNAR